MTTPTRIFHSDRRGHITVQHELRGDLYWRLAGIADARNRKLPEDDVENHVNVTDLLAEAAIALDNGTFAAQPAPQKGPGRPAGKKTKVKTKRATAPADKPATGAGSRPNKNKARAVAAKDELLRLYAAETQVAEIARLLDTSAAAVRAVVSDAIAAGEIPDTYPAEDARRARNAEIIRMYNDGVPVADIAERADLHEVTVAGILQAARKRGEVGLRKNTALSVTERAAIIAERWAANDSYAEIAAAAKMTVGGATANIKRAIERGDLAPRSKK